MRISKRAIVALAAPALLLATPATVAAEENDTAAESDYQTPEESLEHDLRLTAEAKGWTFEQAEAQYEVTEAIGDIAGEIAPKRPEAFVGTALSEEPGGAPTLYLKGEADEFVERVIEQSGQKVIVADGQPYSFVELQERSLQLTEELIKLGYGDIVSAVDITEGTVSAEVAAPRGNIVEADQIAGRLSEELRTGIDLSVVKGLDNRAEHAYGGAVLYDDGFFECTSGWTVEAPDGTTGVTTAGHCNGINEIEEDGCCVFDMTFQTQYQGYWGDVEWHTTNHIEPARFYASPNNLRDTLSIEPWSDFTVGESICMFGRATGSRECGLDVEDAWVSCTFSGTTIDSLVQMDGDVTTGGDSGGPWSWGNRAYGSHVGDCGGKNVFSRVDDFDEAIGVTVRTQ
ncbi:chymotrypsin family serine protease [Glycomyces xiaoerkulensis]|uniref:hypothetical protein n=1 Tax=Glycomyces xiaoerkulensis TaxID=2038139 RepID=UPI000C25E610|nr:hypothetical protein [Glycomyces xiaoerkulensis]